MTDLSTLTPEGFLATLDEILYEYGGDYNYFTAHDLPIGQCFYVINDQPACIIGVALHKLGVSIDYLKKEGQGETYNYNAYVLLRKLRASEAVLDIASKVQWDQDSGKDWGLAVENGRSCYRRYYK